jgi:hypothetical protein
MLYREIIAVCSEIHTKHINTLCGQNVELYLKTQSIPRSKHSVSVIKTNQLMLYREIIAACSEIHTKHINTLCGQNVEFFTLNLAVHKVTIRLLRVEGLSFDCFEGLNIPFGAHRARTFFELLKTRVRCETYLARISAEQSVYCSRLQQRGQRCSYVKEEKLQTTRLNTI